MYVFILFDRTWAITNKSTVLNSTRFIQDGRERKANQTKWF